MPNWRINTTTSKIRWEGVKVKVTRKCTEKQRKKNSVDNREWNGKSHWKKILITVLDYPESIRGPGIYCNLSAPACRCSPVVWHFHPSCKFSMGFFFVVLWSTFSFLKQSFCQVHQLNWDWALGHLLQDFSLLLCGERSRCIWSKHVKPIIKSMNNCSATLDLRLLGLFTISKILHI